MPLIRALDKNNDHEIDAKEIANADKALKAAKGAGADQYASPKFQAASKKLQEARTMGNDPCKYPDAEAAAMQAAKMAADAQKAAVAEKKRLEEEARLAEERRKRRFPPVYTVESGDSLWKITGMERIYGHSKFWPIVHDANSGQIADPDLIFPGQELSIPRDLSQSQMEKKLGVLWLQYAE